MGIETHSETPLARAVRAAGSQSAFGRMIGRRQSTIFLWLNNDTPLPAELVLLVERETGISKHDLRPDIYPHAQASGMPVERTGVACNQPSISQRAPA
ncbi:transcriptional regulator [Sphingomonas sp. 8AM]|uniref:transcriptional regulator n=1 Tax=Sphingomonas sp. 8AM TaxID=2653170 RepID=UPI0012F23F89|nr:YdaS family helix-turn-helix protein [Sphingomonas sp. 8AM]VXC80069.1 DNA-binding transcriptional regulator YdaS, prophage-encoded, Cro superfamily (modular protein) [Sphingomonas sp. 8AM]